MFCPNCGKQIPDGSRFCPGCGTQLGANGGAQQQPYHQPSYQQTPRQPGAAAGQKRKGPPVFLLMVLAVLVIAGGAIAYFAHQSALEKDPLHGAKLKQQTIWETAGLQATVTGLRYDSSQRGGRPFLIDLELRNTGAQAAQVFCESMAVNGIRVGAQMAAEVPAGSSVRDSIRIEDRDLAHRIGLEKIAFVDLVLRAQASGGSQTMLSDVIHLDAGLKRPDAHLNTSGDELYAANGVRVLYTTNYPSYSDSATGIELYVENYTGTLLGIRAENVIAKGNLIHEAHLQESLLPYTLGYVILTVGRNEAGPAGEMGVVTADLTLYDAKTNDTIATFPASMRVSY